MLQTFNFRVEMPCNGCAGRIRQILQAQLEKGAVVSYTVDPIEKLVRITTNLNLDETQAELRKCGKPVTFLSSVNASIFNPGAIKFPKLPPLQSTQSRPTTQPQAANNGPLPTTTYAPPPPPVPAAGMVPWSPVPPQVVQGQSQAQGSLMPAAQGAAIMRQRLNGLSPATANPNTNSAPPSNAQAAKVILGSPPPIEPTFKNFPAHPHPQSMSKQFPPGASTNQYQYNPAARKETGSTLSNVAKESKERTSARQGKKVASSLSRRKRGHRVRRASQSKSQSDAATVADGAKSGANKPADENQGRKTKMEI